MRARLRRAFGHEPSSVWLAADQCAETVTRCPPSLMRTRRVRPAIVCPPGNVARVLGIVRAEKTAQLFDDLAAAHDALCANRFREPVLRVGLEALARLARVRVDRVDRELGQLAR